jgi:hypothetical protein
MKNKSRNNPIPINRTILKLVLNFWTLTTIWVFSMDFFSGNKYNSSATTIGIIYLAILGIYVGEKEYTRWKTKFVSKFIGESFIVVWTIVMAIFVTFSLLFSELYRIPTEFSIVYTGVLGVFAATKHSKNLHSGRK